MLTPDLILSLRASIRWRVNHTAVRGEPHVLWMEAEGAFAVWTDSRPMCATSDPALACWLLRAERAQAGFIAAILDPTLDPETACLDPVERARVASQQRALAASLRAREREDAEAKREASRRLGSGIPSSDPRSLAYRPSVTNVEFDEL